MVYYLNFMRRMLINIRMYYTFARDYIDDDFDDAITFN